MEVDKLLTEEVYLRMKFSLCGTDGMYFMYLCKIE